MASCVTLARAVAQSLVAASGSHVSSAPGAATAAPIRGLRSSPFSLASFACRLPNGPLLEVARGYPIDAVLDTPEAVPEDTKRAEENSDFCFATTCAKLGLVGLAAAALCYTFPALAYKGGGPYGMEVTRGQDLSGKDFSGKTLIKQDFKTSILRQANFKGANLLGASFFDSDLTGADLTDADLRGADFSLANVAKANLTNANLEGALVTGNTSFKGAIITGADFTDVLWREDQRVQLCRQADGINPITGNATRETLLCDLS